MENVAKLVAKRLSEIPKSHRIMYWSHVLEKAYRQLRFEYV